MREVAKSLVQLVAIIMIMITLAISTAALSQWANSNAAPEHAGLPSQTLPTDDASL